MASRTGCFLPLSSRSPGLAHPNWGPCCGSQMPFACFFSGLPGLFQSNHRPVGLGPVRSIRCTLERGAWSPSMRMPVCWGNTGRGMDTNRPDGALTSCTNIVPVCTSAQDHWGHSHLWFYQMPRKHPQKCVVLTRQRPPALKDTGATEQWKAKGWENYPQISYTPDGSPVTIPREVSFLFYGGGDYRQIAFFLTNVQLSEMQIHCVPCRANSLF